jgi:hypothetical protein
VTVAEASRHQRLREHLAYLGMTVAAENREAELDRALKNKLSAATQVPESLLDIEVPATHAPSSRPAAEKASVVLTSNRGFSDWRQVFADPVVATAIVDQ